MEVKHSEGFFDGIRGFHLYEQNWFPVSNPIGNVIIVHGLVDHSRYYSEIASILAHQGFQVHMFDLRGHGRSDGERSYVDSFTDYVSDLEIFHNRVMSSSNAQSKPLFILGHSMGGAIVTTFILSKTSQNVNGIMLSGAALKVGKEVSSVTRMVTPLLSKLAPKTKALKLDINYVSRDPDIIKQKKADPLIDHNKLPIRTGAELLKTINYIQNGMEKLTIPVLIMHGTGDRWTNPEGSQELYSRSKSQDKELKLYDGFYHEILSDPERARVHNDIVEWIKARSNGNMS